MSSPFLINGNKPSSFMQLVSNAMTSDPSEICEESLIDSQKNSSRSNSSDSASLNELEESKDDVQGIALLKQIFPEETIEDLRTIHSDVIERSRPNKKLSETIEEVGVGSSTSKSSASWIHSEQIVRFEDQVFPDCASFALSTDEANELFSAVLVRDPHLGLGMNLTAQSSKIYVHSLNRQNRVGYDTQEVDGPASKAGIRPGDMVIGVNGQSLLSHDSMFENVLQRLASLLLVSPDPVVIHFFRSKNMGKYEEKPVTNMITQSILDTSDFLEDLPSLEVTFQSDLPFYSTPLSSLSTNSTRHPFIATLVSQGLLPVKKEKEASQKLGQFIERAREWELNGTFTVLTKHDGNERIIVPLVGVRKALSVRILNTYQNENNTAYTIWVYDAESGREWYAPVRYFKDFQDLRAATLPLCNTIASLPFPKTTLTFFGSPIVKERSTDKAGKVRQLESFLRSLVAMVYCENIHPAMAEVAHHVQCFLGWDNVVGTLVDVAWNEADGIIDDLDADENHVRQGLKRSIQRYVYRVFLLDIMVAIVENFVDSIRSREPKLEEIEILEAEGKTALKNCAIQELSRVQAFIDHLQDILLLGCMQDFRSISEREAYDLIRTKIHESLHGGGFWDKLVREAVREQIEIEVYVPLRSIISRWLVNGWRHEDMEAHYKMRELSKKSGDFFSVNETTIHKWESVARILKEGVGLSSLPCIKLRAIVDAASEINKIFESFKGREANEDEDGYKHVGADEFLPVFIFCVVKAEIERPCALCVLLRTICDPINRIGETGYYFASFEAAITHLREIDPNDCQNKSQTSFVSIPLDF